MPKTIDMAKCPERYRGALARFIRAGINPGHFLKAVLENNLQESFNRADQQGRNDLGSIVFFIYNEVPVKMYGSRDKVECWGGIARDPDLHDVLEVIND